MLLGFVPFKWCRKDAPFKIDSYHHCGGNLMRSENLPIDRQGLVKFLKTWWKPGEFSKPGESLKKTLVNLQYYSTWWISKTWWTISKFTRFSPEKNKEAFYTSKINQKKRFSVFWRSLCVLRWNWVECGECPKPGQHLENVKTLWKPCEFTRFSPNKRKKHYTHWRDSGKTHVAFHTWNSLRAFQNLTNNHRTCKVLNCNDDNKETTVCQS